MESLEPMKLGGFTGSVVSKGQPDSNLKAVNAFQILLKSLRRETVLSMAQ